MATLQQLWQRLTGWFGFLPQSLNSPLDQPRQGDMFFFCLAFKPGFVLRVQIDDGTRHIAFVSDEDVISVDLKKV